MKFKKSIVIFVLIAFLAIFTGCGYKYDSSYLKTSNFDLDLLALSSDEEIFREFVKIYNNVKLLYGKSISIRGTYEEDANYHYLVVGIMDDKTYYIELNADSYPENGTEVEVTGYLDYYYEHGESYDCITVLTMNECE